MQAVYALHKDPEQSFTAVRKKFDKQLLGAYDLYFVMYALLIAIHKRAIERFEIKNKQEHRKRSTLDTSPNFVENKLLRFLGAHPFLNEKIKKKRIKSWELHFDYVDHLIEAMEKAPFYTHYLEQETNWSADCAFVIVLYKEIIAPNDTLFDYLEDQNLSWADDFSLVNTFIVKQIKKIKPNQPSSLVLVNFNSCSQLTSSDKLI